MRTYDSARRSNTKENEGSMRTTKVGVLVKGGPISK
ncbi:hypothetical protein COLO4_04665 [Corchorus olitorius]|uniref:Uncharacterized protein n=1 Tax=Corchorus olitorius TaxID=93759 RepID=A0A1R3KT72_9ROSI|nr:hypothetical protein COLO4_04665 [Corchorus olitorius]